MSVQITGITKLSHLLVEFYEKMSSWEHDVVKNSGLSPAQMHAIEIVGNTVSLPMKELAGKLGVTTGTLTVMVDRLEEQRLLQRMPHEKDRRSWLVELTDKGRMHFHQHHQYHLRLTEEITATLSAEQQEIFGVLLAKIISRM